MCDISPTLSELPVGTKVFIVNLQSRKELNGQVGVVEAVLSNGRLQVAVTTTSLNQSKTETETDKETETETKAVVVHNTISIKPENTRVYKSVQQQEKEKKGPSPDPLSSLADAVLEFALNTLLGLESAMYKSLSTKVTTVHNHLAPRLLINYLNDTFQSLILKSNEYAVDSFNKMRSFHDHSEICLMHIVMNVCMHMIQAMNINAADTSCYEKFMTSVTNQLKNLGLLSKVALRETLNHECHGEGLDTCDPSKPLFTIDGEEGNAKTKKAPAYSFSFPNNNNHQHK